MRAWVLKNRRNEYQTLKSCWRISIWRRDWTTDLKRARIFYRRSGATNAARYSGGTVKEIFINMIEFSDD